MRAQNYRPRTHSGTHTRRRAVPSALPHHTRSRDPRRKSEGRGQGARVLWILMMIGGLIGSGFVMAQQSQINVHQFQRAEEKFRSQLDELANQQRYLALEKERAINTQESERVAKQSGLIQPKFDKVVAQQPALASPAVPAVAERSTRTVSKPMVKPGAKPVVKPAVQLKQSGKPATAKSLGKSGNVIPPVKVVKGANNRQQLAQKRDMKKEKRR